MERLRRANQGEGELLRLLRHAPRWVGPALAVAAFVVIRLVALMLPSSSDGMDLGIIVRPLVSIASWLVAAGILLVWIAAEIWKFMDRQRLEQQTGIASVRALRWQEFESLVAEAYRRCGYAAEVTGRATGDGGVDIVLRAGGEHVLVQCKHWRAFKVGVGPVRELLGVVVSGGASRGILVTSGRFTREARDFASRSPNLELVDGHALLGLIASVQQSGHVADEDVYRQSSTGGILSAGAPSCPRCGAAMVRRTARRGSYSGQPFWGCSRFPRCRTTRELGPR